MYGYSWRSFFKVLCNDACERPSSWECLQRDFFRLFPTISHCIHIVRVSCSQLPARSGIFCLLVEVVYWPCGLKFVYPMINWAFLRIVVKLPAKFYLYSFEWFCLQISGAKYFFLSCPRHYDWGLIVVIVYYFQIWNKKYISLLLVEVLEVTWVPCILRHSIYRRMKKICFLSCSPPPTISFSSTNREQSQIPLLSWFSHKIWKLSAWNKTKKIIFLSKW